MNNLIFFLLKILTLECHNSLLTNFGITSMLAIICVYGAVKGLTINVYIAWFSIFRSFAEIINILLNGSPSCMSMS